MDNFVKEYIDRAKQEKIDALQKKHGSLLTDEYYDGLEKINNDYEYVKIIRKFAENASKLQQISHSAKYIHSDTKTSNVILAQNQKKGLLLETTDTKNLDVCGNAAFLNGYKFLSLKDTNGKKLQQYIEEDDYTPFNFIECSPDVKRQWYELFKQIKHFDEHKVVDKFAKQILFPLGNNNYITLVPLFPTALYNDLYSYISNIKHGEVCREARTKKRNNQPSDDPCMDIYNLAVIKIGGSNPQNISSFNSQRAGQVFLLDSAAPKLRFKSIYIRKAIKNIFEHRYMDLVVKGTVKSLNEFNEKIGTYKKNYSIRQAQKHFIGKAYHDVCNYLEYIRSQQEEGWTDDYEKLKLEHKTLIDKKFIGVSAGERIRCAKVLKEDFIQFISPKIKNISSSRLTGANSDDIDFKLKDLFDEI